jgi:hypothetical protein
MAGVSEEGRWQGLVREMAGVSEGDVVEREQRAKLFDPPMFMLIWNLRFQ